MTRTLLATFTSRVLALNAVSDFLDAGFINVAQEQDGQSTLVIVDAGDRPAEARTILERYGAVLEQNG